MTLAGSHGTSPNGTWTLYVDDDAVNLLTGSISGGWDLSITTTDVPATSPTPPSPTTPATKKKCKKKKSKKALAAKKCKKKKK